MAEDKRQKRDPEGEDSAAPDRPAPLAPEVRHHDSLLMFKMTAWIQACVDSALEPAHFKNRHYKVMSAVRYQGFSSQQAVAEKLFIDRATMVKIVDDLETDGLITRERDPLDRRHYRITVTSAGVEWITGAEVALAAVEDSVFRPLSAKERAQFHRSLSSLFAE